ncbi:carboxymuconolactone decarboxylase family protein [bacterium]|nr:carboxymuconolactone decarboxylase family protein [bacterium]
MQPSSKRSDPSVPVGPGARTHEQRWDSAAETFRRFVPTAEPERVAASFSRRLGPLGSFAFEVVGDMWNRPQMQRRDRSLLIIATLAAQGRDEELVLHTEIGIRHGLTRVEIEEILPLVAAYAGFPAAMAAARRVDEGLRQAEQVERLTQREGATAKSDEERDAAAATVRASLTGRAPQEPEQDLAEMTAQLGYLGEVTYRWAMGEIWARSQLSLRDRSIVAISILTTLGAERSLATHVQGALHNGLSGAEIEEIISHLGLYVGLPRATDAMAVVRGILSPTVGAQNS